VETLKCLKGLKGRKGKMKRKAQAREEIPVREPDQAKGKLPGGRAFAFLIKFPS